MSRVGAGLDQQTMADALGVNRATVSMWETGRTEPSASKFVRWAELVGQPLDWLAQGFKVRPEGFEPPTFWSVAAPLWHANAAALLTLMLAVASSAARADLAVGVDDDDQRVLLPVDNAHDHHDKPDAGRDNRQHDVPEPADLLVAREHGLTSGDGLHVPAACGVLGDLGVEDLGAGILAERCASGRGF